MWGGVFLETIFTGNYTFGFLGNRSNNLLHLTHWQYWFWFWFSWYLGLYYIVFFNFFFKRSIYSRPKIATSFRSHGKWGDLLVCAVPLSWCFNILINSNFLLRLVEWQHNSTYFSLRVRGKQWYWLYLIESTFFKKVIETKQIGWDSWQNPQNTITFADLELMRFLNKEANTTLWTKGNASMTTNIEATNILPKNVANFPVHMGALKTNTFSVHTNFSTLINQPIFGCFTSYNSCVIKTATTINPLASGILEHGQFNKNLFSPSLIDSRQKISNELLTAVFKQKRFSYSSNNLSPKVTSIQPSPGRGNLDTFTPLLKNSFLFNKRLLRTNKVLLLPTNVNISIITNSFDVIHSWFIPGLGLKLDCVPGRSTQHTLHIMTPGFYYGQCAEICGRYHHHMPIRICAISTPHFLFWWANKGAQGLTRTHYPLTK